MKTNDEHPYLAPALRIALSDMALVVTFHKADGSERQMVCTTRPELIAEIEGRDGTPNYHYVQEIDDPSDLVLAYDLQKGAWRSFYAASVFDAEEAGDGTVPQEAG